LFSYPLREVALRGMRTSGPWSYALSLAAVLSLSSLYEILEWVVAEIIDPEAAFAFLGTQGDVFDAQKDLVLAATGAIIGLAVIATMGKVRAGLRP
jgi:putative membrane protein